MVKFAERWANARTRKIWANIEDRESLPGDEGQAGSHKANKAARKQAYKSKKKIPNVKALRPLANECCDHGQAELWKLNRRAGYLASTTNGNGSGSEQTGDPLERLKETAEGQAAQRYSDIHKPVVH
ncbi:hypothetical protein M513_03474 [Trichuris suis]|nr:hypothetical protein M513_03474 [Trichuris suis]